MQTRPCNLRHCTASTCIKARYLFETISITSAYALCSNAERADSPFKIAKVLIHSFVKEILF